MDERELQEVLDRVDELLRELETHAHPEVREKVLALLEGIDAVHREGLGRLLAEIRRMAGEPFVNRLIEDPLVRLLLMSYELVEGDLSTESGLPPGGAQPVPAGAAGFVSAEAFRRSLQRSKRHWWSLGRVPDVPLDSMMGIDLRGVRVLLCHVGAEFFAYRNQCPGSILPLNFGRLDAGVILCPWHGCHYDARTGRRIDGGTGDLQRFPVVVEGEEIRVALPTEAATTGS